MQNYKNTNMGSRNMRSGNGNSNGNERGGNYSGRNRNAINTILTVVVLIVLVWVVVFYKRTPATDIPTDTSTTQTQNGTQNGTDTSMGASANPANFPNAYQDETDGISLRYPANYTVDASHTYQVLGPGKDISGVKFTIPKALTEGTNLSADSYISVESIPNTSMCTASSFVQSGASVQAITGVNGTSYSVAFTTDAGAGNRYEETVYAFPGTNPCVAVRYFIHYGAIGNYPAGEVREFDKQALVTQFDQIRNTLTLAK